MTARPAWMTPGPLALMVAALMAGCASQPPAPIDGGDRAPAARVPAPPPVAPPVATATVRRGDTLYAIAFARGLDFHDVARWNGIGEPYTIFPGQVLRLGPSAPDDRVAAAAVPPPAATRVTVVERVPAPTDAARAGKPVFVPLSEPAAGSASAPAAATPASGANSAAPAAVAVAPPAPSAATAPAVAEVPEGAGSRPARVAVVAPQAAPAAAGTKSATTGSEPRIGGNGAAEGARGWQWPTDGRLLEAFGASGRKGIVVGGNSGQAIRAARAGEVVYAGGGLLGYGLLVIVKHDDTYLSAYGNNSRLLVKEGVRVEAGQGIAEMGASADGRVGLHFELRRKGQPIDPLTLVKAP